jgi:hypothetical protein
MQTGKTDESVKAGLKIEGDTAPANNDEELLDDELENEDTDTDISPAEIKILDASGSDIEDDVRLQTAELDNEDEDGEALNVSTSADDKTGRDLDVPGADDDDEMEDIGEEDEENNPYSLSDNND